MPEPRRSTLPTRTCVVVTASVLIFGRRLTTFGRFGTTERLVLLTPGSIPAAIIAHTLYYYTLPDALVVDPMAGGGTTLDVCQSMGRRCLAYDIQPVRPEITSHDIRLGFPAEAADCELIFCDPPYHTMLARQYSADGIAAVSFSEWRTLSPRSCPQCVRDSQTRWLLCPSAGGPDRERLAGRIWLPRSRLFRLFCCASKRGFSLSAGLAVRWKEHTCRSKSVMRGGRVACSGKSETS